MFDDRVMTSMLRRPGLLQSVILKELETRYSNGGKTVFIADPNNSVSFLSEAFCSMFSQSIAWESNMFNKLYPIRSVTAEDLFRHTSDYDYVNLTASPSTVKLSLTLDASWLRRTAYDVDENFKQATIPASCSILIGDHVFGIYYPIIFKINKMNDMITVKYDLSVHNPLKTYSTNMMDEVNEYTYEGVNYITIVFTAYQFKQTVENVTPHTSINTGYQQIFPYTNKFNAIRVFSKFPNETDYVELDYTLSQSIYDITKPTVLLTILSDQSAIKVQIPSIYYKYNLVGSSIKVITYTTEGYLNEYITQDDARNMQLFIDPDESVYTNVFDRPPVCTIIPHKSTILTGGSNPVDFATFKRSVINGTLYNQTPITTMQLNDWVSKFGFKMRKYLDNITDRIYFAGAPLVTTDNRIIPMVNSQVRLDGNSLITNPGSIIQVSENMFTILPKTLFRYSSIDDRSYVLSLEEERSLLSIKDKTKLVDYLNTETLTQQPFHVVLNLSGRYPEARTFDFTKPSQESLFFEEENTTANHLISVISSTIEYVEMNYYIPSSSTTISNTDLTLKNNSLRQNSGGFAVYLYVSFSESLKAMIKANTPGADPSLFTVLLGMNQVTGYLYNTSEYIGTESGFYVYKVFLQSNYLISFAGTIGLRFRKDLKVTNYFDFGLTQDFDIKLGIPKSLDPSAKNNATIIQYIADNEEFEDVLFLSDQKLTITFGEDLSKQIFNNIDTSWNQETYATYTSNVPMTYNSAVYQYHPDTNEIISSIDNQGNVSLVTLFNNQDNILSTRPMEISVTENVIVDIDNNLAPKLNYFYVDDVSFLTIGLRVYNSCIPIGTTITNIDTKTNKITISNALQSSLYKKNTVVISNPNITFTLLRPGKDNLIYLTENQQNLYYEIDEAKLTVKGLGIPPNTFLSKKRVITENNEPVYVLELNNNITVSTGTVITIYWAGAIPTYQYKIGDTKLNENGQPIVSTNRNNVYLTTITQFDYKLYASEASIDKQFVRNLPVVFSGKMHSLDDIRDQLLERTELYYRPSRTIGSARFMTGNSKSINMSLDISINILIYVPLTVYNKTTLREIMETKTLSILSNYLQTSNVISTIEIANILSDEFKDNAISINISGLNSECQNQTVKVVTEDVLPSLSYKLKLKEDNTMALVPNVKIDFDVIG